MTQKMVRRESYKFAFEYLEDMIGHLIETLL